ncbi:MAG: methionine adenosyltransferase domain-containing protein [Deltaproteobacteria bacterium]|nr:methionine adenosyltransferase domain-containing protein [Deltaproteobacteria bacterium]
MQPRVHCAEYVSPGHPDRLADAVAEACVQHALALDPLAFAAIEVAVHTDKVFVTGRLAAGPAGPGDPSDFLPHLAREAYRAAGYGTRWTPAPESLQVTHDLCCEPLLPGERAIRDLSDDQAICTGYACDSPATDFLPPAHWLALRLGERLCAWRREHATERLGPDFKLLPVLEEWPAPGGRRRFAWRRLILSVQHATGMSYEEQHRLLLPFLARACEELDEAVPGVARFEAAQLHLNGAGEFCQGGTHGDNGLSGKKLVVDGFGPGVPIGGGAFFGKDPCKPDRRGALRARELAIAEVKAGAEEATVTLVFAPGEREPEVFVERGRAADAWIERVVAAGGGKA